jgi:predicted nuclease of predicted toxin-antitoxin system
MSNFNFCPLVWHFCGEVNTKKVEKIQERALRFIYEDYSITYEELFWYELPFHVLIRFLN